MTLLHFDLLRAAISLQSMPRDPTCTEGMLRGRSTIFLCRK
jgi:hypothetical protein